MLSSYDLGRRDAEIPFASRFHFDQSCLEALNGLDRERRAWHSTFINLPGPSAILRGLTIETASAGLAKALEFSAEELAGRDLLELLRPEDQLNLLREIGIVHSGKESVGFEALFLTKSGERRSLMCCISCGLGPDGVARHLFSAWDFTVMGDLLARAYEEREALTEERDHFRRLATIDGQTGLLTMQELKRQAEQMMLERLSPDGRLSSEISALVADFNELRLINNMYGHPAGDRAIAAIAKEIHRHVRPNQVGGRWGGDEFVLVAADVGADKIMEIAERIRATIHKAGGALRDVSVSVGCSTIGGRRKSIKRLLSEADTVMYVMKETKSHRVDHYKNHRGLEVRTRAMK